MGGGGGAHAWDKTPLNNHMAAIGDSITLAGNNATISISNSGDDLAGSFYGWTLILPKTGDTFSNGSLYPGGQYATGGYNIAQIKETHLPQVLAASPKPGICIVLAGSNNLGLISDQASVDACLVDLSDIYAQLLAAKILPVACAVPTHNTWRDRVILLNTSIQAKATDLGIPFADFFAPTDNGSTGWIAGYEVDGVHPSVTGAKAMAQVLRDVLDHYLAAPTYTLMTVTNEFTLTGLEWKNGVMVDDANADGIPDGGETQGATAWYVATGGADMQYSLVGGDSNISGNWWRMNKVAQTANFSVYFAGGAGAAPILADGHNVAYGIVIKVDSVGGANTIIQILGYKLIDGAVRSFSVRLQGLTGAVAPFVVYLEKITPASFGKLRVSVEILTNTADLSIAQLTVRDLNA